MREDEPTVIREGGYRQVPKHDKDDTGPGESHVILSPTFFLYVLLLASLVDGCLIGAQ